VIQLDRRVIKKPVRKRRIRNGSAQEDGTAPDLMVRDSFPPKTITFMVDHSRL
jgi:hypothetical protein